MLIRDFRTAEGKEKLANWVLQADSPSILFNDPSAAVAQNGSMQPWQPELAVHEGPKTKIWTWRTRLDPYPASGRWWRRVPMCLLACGDQSQLPRWTLPGFLPDLIDQRDEAIHGSSHPGTQNRHNHLGGLEDRNQFRRSISETTSSLGVSRVIWFHLLCGDPSRLTSRVCATLGFEGKYLNRW